MKTTLNYSEITLDHSKPDMLFLQLTEELQRLISGTCLSSNAVLLSARKLADQLKINRTTVGKAYAELLKRGVIERKSSRIFRISETQRRKKMEPFPNIGIILPCRFSDLIENSGGMPLLYIKGIIDTAADG